MYLGIDLGTSSVKVVLMTDDQRIIGTASAPMTVQRPHVGWSEQSPAEWVAATTQTMDELHTRFPKEMGAVRGIGLSGHMHGATLLDAEGNVLRPCILWNDTRSHLEASAMDANPMFRRISGNIVFPGFTAPKLAWVQKNEPDIFREITKVLLPKDHLRYWLTGEYASDMSDASGTSWLDVANRRWSSDLLDATNLTIDQMPRLVEGSEASGNLRPDLCAAWGMRDVVVAGGAGDNAASAIGLGTTAHGSAFVSLGTSGVLFVSTPAYQPNPQSAVHTFCHAVPDTWHQMGVALSATDSLNWWGKVCEMSSSDLTAELGMQFAPQQPLTFLPYLAGERTPHNDPSIRGAFVGLDHSHDRRAMTQAVLEGVAFGSRDSLEALKSTGTAVSRVMAVGGGASSDYWLQILANVLDMPVDVSEARDRGAAFGAARLGLLAATGGDVASICTQPTVSKTFEPDPSHRAYFAQGYDTYRALYPAISGVTRHQVERS
jgi:xylulokinase